MALGEPVDFRPPGRPARAPLRGRYVILRPVDPAVDAGPLFESSRDEAIWRYLPYGPYAREAEMRERLDSIAGSDDPLFFTVATLPDELPRGIVSYLRITPEHGVIEIGHIWFGSSLQRTRAATEAVYLLAANVFDRLGYRRLEWKTNSLNAASRRAAGRFGFEFEGVFRQHQVVKGRNRDTAWYGMTDGDWPRVKRAFEEWLDPANFDGEGRQRQPLRVR